MVRVLTFYSNNPCSNPTEALSVSLNFVFEKNENKQKEAWVGPFIFLKSIGFMQKQTILTSSVIFNFQLVMRPQISGQSCKHSRIITYDSRYVPYIFKSAAITTLQS